MDDLLKSADYFCIHWTPGFDDIVAFACGEVLQKELVVTLLWCATTLRKQGAATYLMRQAMPSIAAEQTPHV